MPVSSSYAPKPFRPVMRFMAIVGWCALIFAASHRPNLRVSDDDLIDFVLRKAAHMFVYGVLLVLIVRALEGVGADSVRAIAAAWCATLAWAISDEWHQTFVVGRAGQGSDVAIDMIGASIAAALVLYRRTSARYQEPEP